MRKPYFFVAVILAVSMLALPSLSSAQVAVGISVRVGPPPLPVYAQPVCPGPNYIWTPGYWAWGSGGYYWVPGTWVLAPEPGLLWTPGYWGFASGLYVWHRGYWGPHVGFYGGINYGFGYFGVGYVGGEWRGREFAYNRAVTRVNINIIHNVYMNRAVVRNEYGGRISYNGGPHGIDARPTREQMDYGRERHFERTDMQDRHDREALRNRAFRYSDNHGRPLIGATQRPGDFSGRDGVRTVPARNEFRSPAPGNRREGDYQPNRTNNQRAMRSNNYVRPRSEAAPQGNGRSQGRSRNEQPRGHQGGDHGRGNGNH
jgi:WXXGXW repeat (2 copies)